MSKIKIENLTVKYKLKKKKEITALENLSLNIKENSLNVILGYSGSGKTTLLKAIAGLIDYSGNIYINDVDANELSVQERNISLVTQTFALYPTMTVFENIAFPLVVNGCSKEEIIRRVNNVAEKLEIGYFLSRKPKHLSGGQQQRVALARALIKKPNIYLFDEPLSNLDSQIRDEIRILIKKIIKETSSTAIYVTHDFNEALALADNLIIINDKKIEIEGTPQDIYKSKNKIVESLKGEQLIDVI